MAQMNPKVAEVLDKAMALSIDERGLFDRPTGGEPG